MKIVAASIVFALIGSEAVLPPPELPAWIVAVHCSGAMLEDTEWTGAKIEVRDDRVRFAEVVIRFDPLELPAEESIWFSRPTAAPVAGFVAWEQFCRDACRDEFVRELLPWEPDPLVARATGGRRCRQHLSVPVDGKRTSQVGLEVFGMSFVSKRSALLVLPWLDARTVTCAGDRFAGRVPDRIDWTDEEYDLDRGTVTRNGHELDPSAADSGPELRRSAADLLDRLLEILETRRPDAGTILGGRPAVRLAAYESRDLARMCGRPDTGSGEVDGQSVGDLALSAAVQPRDEVLSMASIEARLGRDGQDVELAVRLLGDSPAPRHREAIGEILQAAIFRGDTRIASLALRALMKADPDEARRRAESLLDHDGLWRSACGVFVLTDPVLASRYETLDEISIDVRDEIREYLLSQGGS